METIGMVGKERIFNYIEGNFKDKKFLFLENDYDLYRELGIIENFLIDRKIKYHTIFNIEAVPIKAILEVVDFADVILWQSTYVTEISKQLLKLINNYPDKIFIEVQLGEPIAYYKRGFIPDVYVLDGGEDEWFDDSWTLNKLSEKPLWEKNDDEV